MTTKRHIVKRTEREVICQRLARLIERYAEAAIADSWKGGGYPAVYGVIQAELKLARAKLHARLNRIHTLLQE